MNGYRVAIVGATGLVGGEFIKVLEQRNFPVRTMQLFASDRSAGKKLYFAHEEYEVKETAPDSFRDVDILADEIAEYKEWKQRDAESKRQLPLSL